MSSEDKKVKAKMKGVVVSNKANKTIIVSVDTFKSHSKYKKKYKSTKRYKVHDEENKCKVGDIVEFVQCRPISKHKRHKII